MILVDANLLIYAIDADSPHHREARHWLEDVLSGTTRIGFATVVLLAFVRLTTRSGIFRTPLSPESALAYVDSWLAQPSVEIVTPGKNHWPVFRNLVLNVGTAGNLTTDAHLAALAIEHGGRIYSTDNDFKRFPGLTHVNPLAKQ